MVTTLDDDDVRRMGQYSEVTLSERYLSNIDHLRAAEPKRDHSYPEKVQPGSTKAPKPETPKMEKPKVEMPKVESQKEQ